MPATWNGILSGPKIFIVRAHTTNAIPLHRDPLKFYQNTNDCQVSVHVNITVIVK